MMGALPSLRHRRSVVLVALLSLVGACSRESSVGNPDARGVASEAKPSTAKQGSSAAPRLCLAAPVASVAALRCWVDWLASPALAGRAAGSPGGAAARAGLEATFGDLSLGPAGEHGGYAQTLPRGANLLARIPGGDPRRAAEVVVIAAHHDHLGERGGKIYLGADDNASGVAVLLELARRLAAAPPARSVLIAAFDAEEPPAYLGEAMGSIHWMAHPTVPRAQVVAMLAMDLMGGNLWPGARTPLYVMGRETIAAATSPVLPDVDVATRAMHLRLVEDLPGGRQAFSDHGAFFAAQIPVLLFSTGRSPHYHRVSDTPDTLDLEKLAGALAVVEAHLRWLADMPERPGWKAQQPVLAADAAVVAELLATGSAANGSSEFSGLASSVIRADLARMRRLGNGAPELVLTDEEARDVIGVSLRAQCLLTPDDEVPTAACLML
jgi:hypothetical protein